jgi:hypothetical protein
MFGQNDSIANSKLIDMGLYPYNYYDTVKVDYFNNDWINCSPLSEENINDNFSNISDLSWLKDIALKNKVVFLGETHYYNYISNLRNRIFFALNTFDYYPLIVLENKYSMSAYVNYYINIKDEKAAEKFYKEELYDMMSTKDDYYLVQLARKWNKLHPEKKVSIGFHDLEWHYKTTIKRIILPYFQTIDKNYSIDLVALNNIGLGKLIPELRKKCEQAKKVNLIGKYPFITSGYISTVIDNLESTYNSDYYEGSPISYYRQKAMIRNLTDTAFLGKYLNKGKIVIHGGGYHATTHFSYPDNANFYREGSYLNNDYALTKGKTYSILLYGFAYSLGEMANIPIDSCVPQGNAYIDMINNFQEAYKKKLIKPDDYCFYGELDNFYNMIIKKGKQFKNKPLLIQSISWENILKSMSENNKKKTNDYINNQDEFERYDRVIYIPCSPIVIANQKK